MIRFYLVFHIHHYIYSAKRFWMFHLSFDSSFQFPIFWGLSQSTVHCEGFPCDKIHKITHSNSRGEISFSLHMNRTIYWSVEQHDEACWGYLLDRPWSENGAIAWALLWTDHRPRSEVRWVGDFNCIQLLKCSFLCVNYIGFSAQQREQFTSESTLGIMAHTKSWSHEQIIVGSGNEILHVVYEERGVTHLIYYFAALFILPICNSETWILGPIFSFIHSFIQYTILSRMNEWNPSG